MRYLLSLTTTLILFCLVSTGLFASDGTTNKAPRPEDQAIREVVELERHAKEASIHNDANFSEQALADNFIAIGPLGTVVTKSDVVDVRRRSKLHYESIDVSEMVVRVYGDTAIVTAKAEVKGSDFGEEFSGPYRYTRVWVKQNGQWHAVSYQATVTR
jgi:hypothetical protein